MEKKLWVSKNPDNFLFQKSQPIKKETYFFVHFYFYIKAKWLIKILHFHFKWIDQIFYEIIANLFTHSFLSASFTHLNPSNSLRSKYQTQRLHQNSNHCNFFPINFKNIFEKKELSVYIERKKNSIKIN